MFNNIDPAALGLSNREFSLILDSLALCDGIEQALIFGSRATGLYHAGSDVDLAVRAESPSDTMKLSAMLNYELPLPYYFDVIFLRQRMNQTLQKEIDLYGKVIYEKRRLATTFYAVL